MSRRRLFAPPHGRERIMYRLESNASEVMEVSKLTRLEDIDVQLRYLERVRGMQPSDAAIQRIDAMEVSLRRQRKELLEKLGQGHAGAARADTMIAKRASGTGFTAL